MMQNTENSSVESASADRPFVMIHGRRYDLAIGESLPPDPASLPDNERWAGVPGPPRHIPFNVRLFLLLRSGMAPALGWFFLILAALGATFLGSVVNYNDLYYDSCGWNKTELKATIVTSEPLNFSEGEKRVHEHVFKHVKESGEELIGKCYSHERLIPYIDYDLEQSAKSPELFRLRKTTLSYIGLVGAVVLSLFDLQFLVIGTVLVVFSLLKGLRTCRLIQFGEKTKAVPVRIENTSVRVNDIPVRKITYSYVVDGNKLQTSTKSLEIAHLTDEAYEIMFYDPMAPQKTVLLDDLPKKITFDPEHGFRIGMMSLFWPVLFLVLFVWEIAWIISRCLC